MVIFIISFLALTALAYYFGYQKGLAVGKEIGRAASQTEAGTAVQNPLEQMPSTNPFEEVVNPFKELYKNPFK